MSPRATTSVEPPTVDTLRRWTVAVAWLISVAVAVGVTVSWNTSTSASAEDCELIFARLVVLELEEMGYRDPALVTLRQRELAQQFEEQLAACEGRAIPAHALTCVREAPSAEALSHGCF